MSFIPSWVGGRTRDSVRGAGRKARVRAAALGVEGLEGRLCLSATHPLARAVHALPTHRAAVVARPTHPAHPAPASARTTAAHTAPVRVRSLTLAGLGVGASAAASTATPAPGNSFTFHLPFTDAGSVTVSYNHSNGDDGSFAAGASLSFDHVGGNSGSAAVNASYDGDQSFVGGLNANVNDTSVVLAGNNTTNADGSGAGSVSASINNLAGNNASLTLTGGAPSEGNWLANATGTLNQNKAGLDLTGGADGSYQGSATVTLDQVLGMTGTATTKAGTDGQGDYTAGLSASGSASYSALGADGDVHGSFVSGVAVAADGTTDSSFQANGGYKLSDKAGSDQGDNSASATWGSSGELNAGYEIHNPVDGSASGSVYLNTNLSADASAEGSVQLDGSAGSLSANSSLNGQATVSAAMGASFGGDEGPSAYSGFNTSLSGGASSHAEGSADDLGSFETDASGQFQTTVGASSDTTSGALNLGSTAQGNFQTSATGTALGQSTSSSASGSFSTSDHEQWDPSAADATGGLPVLTPDSPDSGAPTDGDAPDPASQNLIPPNYVELAPADIVSLPPLDTVSLTPADTVPLGGLNQTAVPDTTQQTPAPQQTSVSASQPGSAPDPQAANGDATKPFSLTLDVPSLSAGQSFVATAQITGAPPNTTVVFDMGGPHTPNTISQVFTVSGDATLTLSDPGEPKNDRISGSVAAFSGSTFLGQQTFSSVVA